VLITFFVIKKNIISRAFEVLQILRDLEEIDLDWFWISSFSRKKGSRPNSGGINLPRREEKRSAFAKDLDSWINPLYTFLDFYSFGWFN